MINLYKFTSEPSAETKLVETIEHHGGDSPKPKEEDNNENST